MFGFLKDKKQAVSEKEKDREFEKTITTIGAGHAATESAIKSATEAKVRFSKPEQYTGNRTLYDSGKAKLDAKNKLFNAGNIVKDPYTGDILVLTKQEARRLYGEDWSRHLAESDHVKPLEQIYKDTKNNVWNTTDDIKKAANSDDNIRVASRKFNNPKRSRTNEEYVSDETYLKSKDVKLTKSGREQAIKDGRLAEESINKQLRTSAMNNAIKTAHEAGLDGAQNAGVNTAAISGMLNVVSVIKGEKSVDEALIDVSKDTGKAVATGYVMSSGLTVLSQTLSNSSSQFIQGLNEAGVPGKVITAVIITGDTLKKWGNGEITTQQCLIELGDKGVNFAVSTYAGAVGQAIIPIPVVGYAIGSLVDSVIASAYYESLVGDLKRREIEHQERMRIIEECNRVAEETIRFREELEAYLSRYLQDYRECFDMAISSMKFAYKVGDANGVITSANEITRKLGGIVNYDTVEEFASFLDSGKVFKL